MYPVLQQTLASLETESALSESRQAVLAVLIASIVEKLSEKGDADLLFICTHNSRRSQLAQIWGQTAAAYYGIEGIRCYSGGTEETAMYSSVVTTLENQGFVLGTLSGGDNPLYHIRYGNQHQPLLGFSKKYNHSFNPSDDFIAVMTCSQADGDCPFVGGASHRVAVGYSDPKAFDGQPDQEAVYAEKSMEIAQEMGYVFSQLKNRLCKPE